MPLTQYRIQNLAMGTFTCVYIPQGGLTLSGCADTDIKLVFNSQKGGLIFDGCADVLYVPPLPLPTKCFKFYIGEEVYLENGKKYIIVGFADSGQTIFYKLQYGNYTIEVPESSVYSKGCYLEYQKNKLEDIASKAAKIEGVTPLPDPSPGVVKVKIAPCKENVKFEGLMSLEQKTQDQINKLQQRLDAEQERIRQERERLR